ncbi:MAG: hypothetical protein ACPGR8_06405 [Limisphaerales bacterium]
MLAAAVIGGALVVGSKMAYGVDPLGTNSAPDKFKVMRENELAQYMATGAVARRHNNYASRVPWRSDNAPYHMYRPSDPEPHVDVLEKSFRHMLNATEHLQREVEEDFANNRDFFPWKSGGAIPAAFTRELYLGDGKRTSFVATGYLPPNTTDEDIRLGHAMARRFPRDHTIAADSHYWTVPGQDFRHGGRGR